MIGLLDLPTTWDFWGLVGAICWLVGLGNPWSQNLQMLLFIEMGLMNFSKPHVSKDVKLPGNWISEHSNSILHIDITKKMNMLFF